MSRELFLCDRKAAIVEIPRNYSSDDWWEAQKAFAKACGKRDPEAAYVSCHTLYEDQCKYGVYYSWGLAGPDGAWYEIYRFPETDPDDLAACRREIKIEGDVVRLTVYTIREWVPFELPQSSKRKDECDAKIRNEVRPGPASDRVG